MKSLKKNYLYNLIYQIFMILTPFITTPYVSRVLGASGIGEYSYVLSIATYFGIFGLLGITTYAQVEIAKNRDDSSFCNKLIVELFTLKNMTMLIAIILYIIMIMFINEYRKMFVVLILYLLCQLSDVSWILQGFEEFKKTVFRNIIVKTVTIVMIFSFIKKPEDLYFYSIIMQGVTLLGNFLLWQYVWQYINFNNIKQNFKFNCIWIHLKRSLVYFIPTVATSIYTVLDKSMIGWLTHSILQNGYYEQAHKIEQILVTVLTSLGTVTLPRMSYLNSINDNKKMKDIVEKTLSFILMISIPMCIGLIMIAKDLIPLFLGNNYDECILLTQVFSLLLIIVGLDNTIGRQCLMATGNQKKFNIGVIVGAIANFILNLILIPMLLALGAAISSVISELLILILFLIFSKKYLKINFDSIFKYILSSFFMALFIYIFSLININIYAGLLLKILIGFFVYFISLIMLKDKFLLEIINGLLFKLKNKIIYTN